MKAFTDDKMNVTPISKCGYIKDRKHGGKGEKKLIISIFSLFTNYYQKLYLISQGSGNLMNTVNGLTLSQTNLVFTCLQNKLFGKHCRKRRNCS